MRLFPKKYDYLDPRISRLKNASYYSNGVTKGSDISSPGTRGQNTLSCNTINSFNYL